MQGAVLIGDDGQLGRKKDLVYNLDFYLREIGGGLRVVTIPEFLRNHKNYDFVYKPITVGDLSSLSDKSFDLPIIIDRADNKVPTLKSVFSRYLIRSAFGQSPKSIELGAPTQSVPLVPPPIRENHSLGNVRDIICFDLKPFHERSTVLTASAFFSVLVENWNTVIKTLNFEPYIYFTSFFDFNYILRIVEQFTPNVRREFKLKEVIDRIILPAKSQEDYLKILDRSLFFVTEHGDIADWDVSYCVQAGIPLVLYVRGHLGRTTGVQSCIVDAWKVYSSSLPTELKKIRQSSLNFSHSLVNILNSSKITQPLNRRAYLKAYRGSLDDGFSFLRGRSQNTISHDKCTNGFKWNKGVEFL